MIFMQCIPFKGAKSEGLKGEDLQEGIPYSEFLRFLCDAFQLQGAKIKRLK